MANSGPDPIRGAICGPDVRFFNPQNQQATDCGRPASRLVWAYGNLNIRSGSLDLVLRNEGRRDVAMLAMAGVAGVSRHVSGEVMNMYFGSRFESPATRAGHVARQRRTPLL